MIKNDNNNLLPHMLMLEDAPADYFKPSQSDPSVR